MLGFNFQFIYLPFVKKNLSVPEYSYMLHYSSHLKNLELIWQIAFMALKIEWCDENMEYIEGFLYLNNKIPVFYLNFESSRFVIRQTIAVVIKMFENFPFSKVLVINGIFLGNLTYKEAILNTVATYFLKYFTMHILKWLPGSLSNMEWVFQHWSSLIKISKLSDNHSRLVELKKKLIFTRGFYRFSWIPSLIFFLSGSLLYANGLCEAWTTKIPNISILNSNAKFNNVLYPIRGGDGEWYAVALYIRIFVHARRIGKENALEKFSHIINSNLDNRFFQKSRKNTFNALNFSFFKQLQKCSKHNVCLKGFRSFKREFFLFKQ